MLLQFNIDAPYTVYGSAVLPLTEETKMFKINLSTSVPKAYRYADEALAALENNDNDTVAKIRAAYKAGSKSSRAHSATKGAHNAAREAGLTEGTVEFDAFTSAFLDENK